MRNPFGASWLPKVAGIVTAVAVIAKSDENKSIAKIGLYVEAAGIAMLGATVRQNGVTSEKAGAVK